MSPAPGSYFEVAEPSGGTALRPSSKVPRPARVRRIASSTFLAVSTAAMIGLAWISGVQNNGSLKRMG